MGQLDGHHIVVTGAGRGIGAALAMAVSAEGAMVTCLDIDGSAADETAQHLVANGARASATTCDITDIKQVESAIADAVQRQEPITGLIANAGGAAGERTPFLELTPNQWQRMVDRNLNGAFNCGSVFGRYFAARESGSIVFVTSSSATVIYPELAHYCAAKAGTQHLMHAMAVELGAYQVRVNAIAPGVTQTPGNAATLASGAMERTLAAIPLKRAGNTDDMCGAAIYLLGDSSAYTTGATIAVDGGSTLL